MIINKSVQKAFTLIELLVVIAVIGILLGLSIFGLQGARQASRDAKRKADLEAIRSGLEIYKSDCAAYPIALGTTLIGNGTSTCPVTNTYIATVPVDPTSPTSKYAYLSDGLTYTLCASLEQVPQTALSASPVCGGCTTTCNYRVVNP